MAIAPLSACRLSTVIPHLSVRRGPFLLEEMPQNMYAQKHCLKIHAMSYVWSVSRLKLTGFIYSSMQMKMIVLVLEQ